MKILLFSFVVLCGALTGCVVEENPAHTRVYYPGGNVDYHCPPGQAKKGRC